MARGLQKNFLGSAPGNMAFMQTLISERRERENDYYNRIRQRDAERSGLLIEEYDESDEYEEEEIDNSDMSFDNQNICILLNNNEEKNRRLKNSETALMKKFPKLKELPSENRMQQILEGMFPEGFQKQMYVRNLTFTNKRGHDVKLLGIRPERTPGDFMEDYLPNDVSLLFKGHIAGKEFVVDSVFEVMDVIISAWCQGAI